MSRLAESVRDLGESPFTVIPIFSILFRTFDKANATFGVAAGVGSYLFIWLSGGSPLLFLPGDGYYCSRWEGFFCTYRLLTSGPSSLRPPHPNPRIDELMTASTVERKKSSKAVWNSSLRRVSHFRKVY